MLYYIFRLFYYYYYFFTKRVSCFPDFLYGPNDIYNIVNDENILRRVHIFSKIFFLTVPYDNQTLLFLYYYYYVKILQPVFWKDNRRFYINRPLT